MKRLLVAIMLCLLSNAATAIVYVEDFEFTPPPDQLIFDNPNGIFNYEIRNPVNPIWAIEELSHLDKPSQGKAISLESTAVVVRFNLQPGQYVEHISFDYVKLDGDTSMALDPQSGFRSGGAYYGIILEGDYGDWNTYSTVGKGYGKISWLYLTATEGAFDNITINVIPEPATMAILSLGGLAILRKRRV